MFKKKSKKEPALTLAQEVCKLINCVGSNEIDLSPDINIKAPTPDYSRLYFKICHGVLKYAINGYKDTFRDVHGVFVGPVGIPSEDPRAQAMVIESLTIIKNKLIEAIAEQNRYNRQQQELYIDIWNKSIGKQS